MNNKQLGNKFEEDFAKYLSNNGYWTHLVAGAKHTSAQPCDIICIKNNETTLYDCKTLNNKGGIFPIERVEENQRRAFKRLKECKNNKVNYFLSIIWNNDVYKISLEKINFEKDISIDLKQFEPDLRGFYENIGRL